jgi:hypothetical protein
MKGTLKLFKKIHESEYGKGPMNFHVTKSDDTLNVTLTYPPWTDADNKNNQCRYIHVDQEAVRASDGLRLHYDYDRDGFVVEQPRTRLIATGKNSYEEQDEWIEVGFFQSWHFDQRPGCEFTAADYEAADREFEAKSSSSSASSQPQTDQSQEPPQVPEAPPR